MDAKVKNLIIKYIAQSIDNFIQDDIITMIISDSDKNTSPIVFSLANIWEKGQYIEIDKKEWLIFENKLTKIIKELNQDCLCEFIRLLVTDELYNLSIWTNIADKISPYIVLAYITLYDNDIIYPMVEKINRIFDNPDIYILEIKEKYNIENLIEGIEENNE